MPTSSLLHKGVVLVPQFAHESAPTVLLTFLFTAAGALTLTLASLSTPPTPALGLAAPSTGLGEASSCIATSGPILEEDEASPAPLVVLVAAAAAARAALAPAAAVSSSNRAESTLLYVGHPLHALVPPVPSHRPSPGHVPPVLVRWGLGVAEGVVDVVVGFGGILDVDLPFGVVPFVTGAVVELLNELGAKGDVPTVVEESLLTAGGGVRPRDEGRGMCFDF